ncbi:hypothetical protein K474DRAFT_1707593 [Panus rudis PR-1116 ss-1]|nr:hypothetical protein K474DRAFT_1707593 [Panus rudis PR-1116 ss-1]
MTAIYTVVSTWLNVTYIWPLIDPTVEQMSQYAHLSTPDKEVETILVKLPPRPDFGENFVARREAFRAALPFITQGLKEYQPAENTYRVEDHTVPVENGSITVRVIVPTPPNNEGEVEYPLFVWYHGGGYVLGSVDMDDYLLRRLAVELKTVVFSVEYRLAPEHAFPIGLNDSYAALKWAAENAAKFSASPSRGFIIGGASSGGNFAAVLALRARNDAFFANKKLTGQLLQAPQVVHPEADLGKYSSEILSWEENQDAPLLTRKELLAFAKVYGAPSNDPNYSVLLAPDHKGLPPAVIQVCGLDPVRDEALLYEKVLRESGVPTKLEVYPGLPHGGHYALSKTAIGKKFIEDFKAGLKWLLEGGHSSA